MTVVARWRQLSSDTLPRDVCTMVPAYLCRRVRNEPPEIGSFRTVGRCAIRAMNIQGLRLALRRSIP